MRIRNTGEYVSMPALSALKTAIPALLLLTPAIANAEPEAYKLDPTHTAIQFEIDHFGFSSPTGKWMSVDGTLMLDEDDPAASSIELTIDVNEVNTGVPALDEHLRKEDFFNVAEYPEATFVSTDIELTGEDTAKVTGDLTLHGVTKPVVLDVTLNQIAENMFGLKTAGFKASTTLVRSDFGIDTYAPALGDEVKIYIQSEANLAADLEEAE